MIAVIAASDKAKVLADRLGGVFLSTLPDTVSYEKILVLPCFIYGGYEYLRAVGKIKNIYPNADILPPLIRSENDYYVIKKLVSQSESDIFCIHKSKALDISDKKLWKTGESDETILKHIKEKGLIK